MRPGIETVAQAHEIRYAYTERIGPYFEDEGEILVSLASHHPGCRLIVVRLDDPDVVPADQLRSRFGFEISGTDSIPEGQHLGRFAPGKFAVMDIGGSEPDPQSQWKFLYEVWLPHSGESVRGLPGFELYSTESGPKLAHLCVALA